MGSAARPARGRSAVRIDLVEDDDDGTEASQPGRSLRPDSRVGHLSAPRERSPAVSGQGEISSEEALHEPGPWRHLSRVEPREARARVHGKFLYVGHTKFWIRGVTYGTFRPDTTGSHYGSPDAV